MKKFLLALAILTLAFAISPVVKNSPASVSLNAIHTDAVQTFDAPKEIVRAWFVEAVLPTTS